MDLQENITEKLKLLGAINTLGPVLVTVVWAAAALSNLIRY